MPTGTTTVTFGATEGKVAVKVSVVGQASIVAGSLVEAWIRAESTASHSVDEHFIEDLEVKTGNILAGTGFDIQVECKTGTTVGQFNLNWAWI